VTARSASERARSGFAEPREVEDVVRRGWRLEGRRLSRELEFRDFEEAMAFALQLGREAVDWHRRPDMLIRSHLLVLSIENLHHDGFTLAEIRLANKATDVIDERQDRGTGRG
jgi:pterin-4a-carbinolamine dehydratase